jgi:hypothetical protein
VLSSGKANSVDVGDKVHVYCETKYKNDASITVVLTPKYKASICIALVDECYKAEGKVYIDKYSGTNAYVSSNNTYCR